MEQARIFILDQSPGSGLGIALRGVLESLSGPLTRIGGSASGNGGGVFDPALLAGFRPHLIFFVISAENVPHAKEVIALLRGKIPGTPLLVAGDGVEPKVLIELLRSGAADFFLAPFRSSDVLPRVWRTLGRRDPDDALVSVLKERIGLKQMVGQDPAFLAEISKIPKISDCDASVLILGDTGTGKELCARAIHYLSPRTGKPFIPVNCGAIPTELMENELFGHVKGAFTGASTSYPGLISEAEGGTLFLDEIDGLSPQAQVKLLRFLQDREYRPLGSTQTRRGDVRIIAASSIDLGKAAGEGRFRRALFYRLNIIPLALPALHARKGDIPLLAGHFLEKYALEFKKPARAFSPDALKRLLAYDWPGNIRELENVIECSVIFCPRPIVESADLPLSGTAAVPYRESLRAQKSRVIAEFEKKYLRDLLAEHQGNISRAAKAAQKNRRAFWELMRKHKIETLPAKTAA